jgi:hypothetical protein
LNLDLLTPEPGMLLSPHLTWGEATRTDHREFLDLQDDPPPIVRLNLRRLAVDLYEPARELVGPMRVNSGYRCPELNAAVSGSKTSAHMDGRALDLFPLEMDLLSAFRRLVASGLPYDQAILEYTRWIHLAIPATGLTPRREALRIDKGTGYVRWKW